MARPLDSYKRPKLRQLKNPDVWRSFNTKKLFFDPWKMMSWRLIREFSQVELGRRMFPVGARPDVPLWNYEHYKHVPCRENIERMAAILRVPVRKLMSTADELAANKLLYNERQLGKKEDRFK